MAQTKGSEFYVKLEGIKLPQEAEERIAEKVRATIMRELAALDLKKSRGGGEAPTKGGASGTVNIRAIMPSKDWYGLLMISAAQGRLTQFNASAVNAGKITQVNTLKQTR